MNRRAKVTTRTEDDKARDLLAELKSRGFRICELAPKTDAHYLEGKDVKEWRPIDNKHAIRVLSILRFIVRSHG